jgi:pimeloyl-ACP methyl ester carboxylesterase
MRGCKNTKFSPTFTRMESMIEHPDYQCEYFVYGTGKKIIFAFHGFGNHATDFKPLEQILGDEYTIVSVNLFFHGRSSVLKQFIERGFSIDQIRSLTKEFMDRFPAVKYELMGFSLGGRIAMKLAELFPHRISRLILLAPDGLTVSPFYRLSTLNLAGRFLFKKSIDKADSLVRIANLLKKYRLIDEKKYQLAMYHLESKEYRQRVYDVWMVFRKIRPDIDKLRTIISKNNLKVRLFFGRYDKIILPEWGKILEKGLEKNVKTTLIETGHQIVRYGFLEQIGQKIKNDAG